MIRGQSLLVARLAVGAIALMGGALWSGCGTDVPIRPRYKTDIAPLMEAHCIRCHGAGGTLNDDPDQSEKGVATGAPTNGYFTQLGDVSTGQFGLLHYATDSGGVVLMNFYLPKMPPSPAAPLDDWEFTLLTRWLASPLP